MSTDQGPSPAPSSQPPAAPASPAPGPPGRWRRWRRPVLGSLAVLLLLYTAAGFWLAPRLLRDALVKHGGAQLHRQVQVGEIRVNPFTLVIQVDGLTVADTAAPRLLAWDSLRVRLAPWKLLVGLAGVADIRLTRPYVRLALDGTGRLNVQDLIDGDGATPAPPPESKKRPILGVALDNLEIVEARLVFADATRHPTFETELGPLTVRLADFRTTGDVDSPYSIAGSTEAGETFQWKGTVHTDPLRSSGALGFSGVKLAKYGPYQVDEAPALLVESGTLSIDAGYRLELGAGKQVFTVSRMKLVVDDLALARRRDGSRALAFPHLEVNGIELDVLARRASVAEVKVEQGTLWPRRDPDGRMALLEMLERPPAPPSPTPWSWSVAAVVLRGLTVELEDRSAPRPVRLSLSDLGLRLTGLASDPKASCPLQVSMKVGDAGGLSLDGTVRPLAGTGEVKLEATAIDLVPLAPYADGASPLRFAAGTLGLQARASWDASGAQPRWTFAGDVRLDGFNLRHPTRDEDLVRWRSLELLGLEAASTRRASLRIVRLTEPRLRAVVFEDGSTGLARPEPPEEGSKEAASATPAPPAAATGPNAPPAGPAPWRTAIAVLQVVRGRASLTDRSTTPPVHAALEEIEARIANLSSDPKVRSTVDVTAKVDGAAPLTVTGTVNPLQQEAYTDLAIRTRGVDLTPLGPYAGKHLGYLIQKGKLDLDLGWKVEERRVRAGNVIRFDQFTLGEATGSKDATSLPVRLALAILTDKEGVILLDVPAEGNLDDPKFRLGRVIWHTIQSLLVKVAASPFSALASLVGGGQEDISLVQFPAGEATLDESARKRIALLGKSLAERPRLGLELGGAADPKVDALALQRVELERLLRRTKGAAARPPIAEEAVQLAPEERPRWLAAALAATFPAPPETPRKSEAAPPPDPAAQEARLLSAIALPPEALPALATARAQAARDALLATGLDPARIFMVESMERASKEPAPRVYFGVR
jgi:hypothetical protein